MTFDSDELSSPCRWVGMLTVLMTLLVVSWLYGLAWCVSWFRHPYPIDGVDNGLEGSSGTRKGPHREAGA